VAAAWQKFLWMELGCFKMTDAHGPLPKGSLCCLRGARRRIVRLKFQPDRSALEWLQTTS